MHLCIYLHRNDLVNVFVPSYPRAPHRCGAYFCLIQSICNFASHVLFYIIIRKHLISSTVIHARDKVSTISYGAPWGPTLDRMEGIEISPLYLSVYGDGGSKHHSNHLVNNKKKFSSSKSSISLIGRPSPFGWAPNP